MRTLGFFVKKKNTHTQFFFRLRVSFNSFLTSFFFLNEAQVSFEFGNDMASFGPRIPRYVFKLQFDTKHNGWLSNQFFVSKTFKSFFSVSPEDGNLRSRL